MRYQQGYSDGSGQECVRDTQGEPGYKSDIPGATIAVTNWGCSCCQGETTPEHTERAAEIVKALNVLDAVQGLTEIGRTADGGIIVGPQGWARLQEARG